MPDNINWETLTRNPDPREERKEPPKEQNWLQKLFAPVLAAGAAVIKFAWPVLKFLPLVLKTGGSMILSIGAYALLYGWKFAAGFVLLMLVHELGHAAAARAFGIPVSAPVFIPFMGAAVILQSLPPNAWVAAVVGLAGPFIGGVGGGLFCYMVGNATGSPLAYALASAAFLLNLFNLVPVQPFDGGRVVPAISPWLSLLGIVLMVPWLAMNLSGIRIYLLILVLMSIPRVWRQFKNRNDPQNRQYFELEAWQQAVIGLGYFGTIFFLAVAMSVTQRILPSLP